MQKLFNNCGECLDRPPRSPEKWRTYFPHLYGVKPKWQPLAVSSYGDYLFWKQPTCPEMHFLLKVVFLQSLVKMIMFIKVNLSCYNGTIFSTPYRICWVICYNCVVILILTAHPQKNSIWKFCFTVCLPGNTTRSSNI